MFISGCLSHHRRTYAHSGCPTDRSHDLYAFWEDDLEITAKHVDAFRAWTQVLPPDMIAGFLLVEHRHGHDPAMGTPAHTQTQAAMPPSLPAHHGVCGSPNSRQHPGSAIPCGRWLAPQRCVQAVRNASRPSPASNAGDKRSGYCWGWTVCVIDTNHTHARYTESHRLCTKRASWRRRSSSSQPSPVDAWVATLASTGPMASSRRWTRNCTCVARCSPYSTHTGL